MADIIIVLILIVIAVFAIKQTKKHMHGESPCCGGGSGTVKKVKEKHLDGPVMGTKTMKIKGMTCEHCVNNVTNALVRSEERFSRNAETESIFKR